MAEKFLEHDSAGGMRENEGQVTSAGAGDAGKIPALDSTGRLDTTLMPVGVEADTGSLLASEDLAAGNWVNVWNDGGTAKVRKADATTTGKECDGFVLSAFTASTGALVYFEGINTQVSGRTPGTTQFLSTTAGGSVETAPSSTGNVVQQLGKSLSATEVQFEKSDRIELA